MSTIVYLRIYLLASDTSEHLYYLYDSLCILIDASYDDSIIVKRDSFYVMMSLPVRVAYPELQVQWLYNVPFF